VAGGERGDVVWRTTAVRVTLATRARRMVLSIMRGHQNVRGAERLPPSTADSLQQHASNAAAGQQQQAEQRQHEAPALLRCCLCLSARCFVLRALCSGTAADKHLPSVSVYSCRLTNSTPHLGT
jgi:hypothetical protein